MSPTPALGTRTSPGGSLDFAQVGELVRRAFSANVLSGKRVLAIVPDGTRSGPMDLVFRALFDACEAAGARGLDALVALGTHQPMSEAAVCGRLGIGAEERRGRYARVGLYNHAWDDPAALTTVGTLSVDDVRELSDGRFAMEVPVEVNRRLFDYDLVVIIGPVFPHEVVGFSGGNKYLFPGVAGPRILNFFHWLGAVVTNPRIIGHKHTPVRRVVDRAAAMVNVPKLCCALVVQGARAEGLYIGTPEAAWEAAADHSAAVHVSVKAKPFHTVLSVLPAMYEDLWTGGKGMYKLEPVVADGGEVILYAPHIREVSVVHGHTLLDVGYHCRDYFLQQWERFSSYPWGVLAHSTHVRGGGTFEDGVERCRVKVTAATSIPREVCERINLGWRDPASIRPEDFANREDEGVLFVPKAGEVLYRLAEPPDWARA